MGNIKGNKSNILNYKQKLNLVNDYYLNKLTLRELSKKYNISYSTARIICLKYKQVGSAVLLKEVGSNAKIKSNFANLDKQKEKIKELSSKLKNASMIIEFYEYFVKNIKLSDKELTEMKMKAIDKLKEKYPIYKLCEALQTNTTSYYRSKKS